jgi:Mor family transcriptional regulator
MNASHPDEQITERYRRDMNVLAGLLDHQFNGDARPKRVAFVLLITEFDNMAGRVNYISNGERKDIVVMLKEILARFEGQAEQKGTA